MSVAVHDGLKFHVQEMGEGPPVVMLHGLLAGSMATWYFTAAPALAKSHRVMLFDLRGHGKTERAATGYDVATMARDLDALATVTFAHDPIALVGHSYGASVALRFALDHPERVSKLVLVEAPIPASRIDQIDEAKTLAPGEMAGSLLDALSAMTARKSNGRHASRFLEGLRRLATETSVVDDLRAARDIDDAELARLKCPLVCIYGTRSGCRPVGERLARVVPNAKLVLLEGGHYLPVEDPRALTSAIVEQLDG